MVASVGGGFLTVTEYERGLHVFYSPFNIQLMLIKSFVFAFIFSSIACFQGYNVKGGTIQLATASTKAVVYADILILLSDYILAQTLLS
ncbi:MAG: ABC transporter permease, partial [Chitinophagales bacterium]